MTTDNVLLAIVIHFLKLCMFAALTMVILNWVSGSEVSLMRFSTNLLYGTIGYISYLALWQIRHG